MANKAKTLNNLENIEADDVYIDSLSKNTLVLSDNFKKLVSLDNSVPGSILFNLDGTPSWVLPSNPGTGIGGVVSVGLATSSPIFTVTNSPVTSAGTLTINLSSTPTGSGSVVLSTSPTLVTPNIGAASGTSLNISSLTASRIVYTNSSKDLSSVAAGTDGQVLSLAAGIPTWQSPAGGTVSSVGISVPSFLSVSNSPITSSGTIAITGASTGTGTIVLNTSPSLVTPDIGAALGTSLNLSSLTASRLVYTNSSKDLISVDGGTNGQVLGLSGGIPTWQTVGAGGTVTSVGISVPSFLSVANSPITSSGTIAITGASTGSGSVVLNTSPSLVTPNIGAASGTSLNLSALTASRLVYTNGSKDLISVAGGTNGQVLGLSAGIPTWQSAGAGGTVSSVGISVPSFLSVSNTPITTTGTIAITGASTGTGTIVLSTSPTLVTPNIGDATGIGLVLSSSPGGLYNGLTTNNSNVNFGSESGITLQNGSLQAVRLYERNVDLNNNQFKIDLSRQNSIFTNALTIQNGAGNIISTTMAGSLTVPVINLASSSTTIYNESGGAYIDSLGAFRIRINDLSLVNVFITQNRQTYRGSTGSNTSPTFNFINEFTVSTPVMGIRSPNIPTGSYVRINTGVALTNFNSANIDFNYNGVSSVSNTIGLGVFGGPNVTIDGAGNMVVPGSLSIPSFRTNDGPIYYRSGTDVNHGTVFSADVNGPNVFGQGGGKLSASSTISASWNSSGLRLNTVTPSQALFVNSSRDVVSRPGFSYQVWLASANTPLPENVPRTVVSVFLSSSGGTGQLTQQGTNATFRNNTGVPMLYGITFAAALTSPGTPSFLTLRILVGGVSTSEMTKDTAAVEVESVSGHGIILPGQDMVFELNNNSTFGRDANRIRIAINTYPFL